MSNTLKVNTHLTAGEAFFILQGSPQKLSKSINPSTNPEMSVETLLQFDLKFDALKTYLEGFSTVINQHASLINTIQTDVQTRLIETNLYGVIEKLGISSIMKDKAISSVLLPMLQAPKPENTGKRHEDTVNSFCNRLELFTHGFSHFHKVNSTYQERFTKVESHISQKVNTEDFRAKVKKTKTKLRKTMEDNYKSLDDKIKMLESKLNGRMDGLDKKIDEVEKHTTWRIKDCEDLLRSRINDTYVDDSIRLLEERLAKEIQKITEGNTENIQKSLKELNERLKSCEDQVDNKVSSLKNNIREIENHLTRKLDISKFEEFKKEIQLRIDTESEKIRNVQKKCEPAVDRLSMEMKTVNEDIAKLRAQIKELNIEMENLQVQITNIPSPQVIKVNDTPATTTVIRDNTVEAEALKAEMENNFSRYRMEINKLREKIRIVEESVENKVELSFVNTLLLKKLDVSEFERLLSSIQSDNDKIKRLLQNNEELQSKIDKIEELINQKIAKLKKELDIANLLKQLKTKAEEENVFKGFENTDKKINTLSESLLALKKEFDNAFATLEKLSVQMFSFSDNASLSTKKLNPQNCLSCGNLARNFNPPGQLMGVDGKFYKSDRDLPEIYEGIHSTELRAVLGKTLIPKDKLNVNYTITQNTVVNEGRMRPQTANSRGKFFQNNVTTISSPSIQTPYTLRPGSAKK